VGGGDENEEGSSQRSVRLARLDAVNATTHRAAVDALGRVFIVDARAAALGALLPQHAVLVSDRGGGARVKEGRSVSARSRYAARERWLAYLFGSELGAPLLIAELRAVVDWGRHFVDTCREAEKCGADECNHKQVATSAARAGKAPECDLLASCTPMRQRLTWWREDYI
jgi:hypothetical protein